MMNGYELSRVWFEYCFENPEKVQPAHTAIYFFAIEHCNRLGWKKKFGFPTAMAMDALGIKKHHTYIKYFNDLVEWGFFELVQKSQNQYSANIIILKSAVPKSGKALGRAAAKHTAKHPAEHGQSTGCIIKPNNSITKNHIKGSPPDLPDVIRFFEDNGYTEASAKKAFEYYNDANWHDSKGNKVLNWKQKMRVVWFRDEHKKQAERREIFSREENTW